MNVRIFWVRAMKCMCAQTRPRFILSSEGVFGGMEFEPMLTPREKSPLLENVPRGGSNPRRCGQRAQALRTELFRPPSLPSMKNNHWSAGCLCAGLWLELLVATSTCPSAPLSPQDLRGKPRCTGICVWNCFNWESRCTGTIPLSRHKESWPSGTETIMAGDPPSCSGWPGLCSV